MFIGQLWRGEKECFKNDEYDNVKLPHYAELKTQNLIDQVKDDPEIQKYMHDKFATTKRPSRKFLLNIIGTVYPGYFKKVIAA